jgi:flagellar protein FliS
MQQVNPYLKQYKKNQIEMSTPEQILILLYDAAIQYLNKAKINIEQQDEDLFQHNMLFANKIIMELMNSLIIKEGDIFAQTLYRLYEYLGRVLSLASVCKDIGNIDEVLKHLIRLRETWQKAIDMVNNEKEFQSGEGGETSKEDFYDDVKEYDDYEYDKFNEDV